MANFDLIWHKISLRNGDSILLLGYDDVLILLLGYDDKLVENTACVFSKSVTGP